MKHSSKKGLKQKDHNRGLSSVSSGSGGTSVGGGGNFKGKETRLSKPSDTPEECTLSFPDLRIVDNNRLPCYLSILNKSKEEMIGMDDLDNLQLELETLLSAVSVRIRDLQGEIVTLSSTDEKVKDKKGKLATGKTVLKKEEKPVIKISKPSKDNKLISSIIPVTPPIKAKSKSTPLGIEQDILVEHPLPEIGIVTEQTKIVPKNDTPNKFWAYVETYCAEITADDVKYLEDLIANCEKDADVMKIPPLGKHYTLRWAEEDLAEERDASSGVKLKRKSTDSTNASSGNTVATSGDNQSGINNNNSSSGATGPKDLLKKASKLCSKELIPGPLAQRLISALLEEHVAPLQDSGNKLKVEKQIMSNQEVENPAKRQKLDNCPSNGSNIDAKGGENAIPNYVKRLPHYHSTACFERRIRRGLEVAGFLDSQPPQEENDEILKEIKKCQEELRSCALHNITQLKNVLKLAHAEVARNQVRKKLRQTDAEIVEIYRRMTAAKLKKKQISKKEREQAWKVLKNRESWLKHFESLPSGLLA